MPVQGGGLDSAALGRRSLLGALGLAATGGFAATVTAQTADDVGDVSIAQGGECVPVVPLVGDESVETLYDLRIPESFGGENGASDPGEGPYYQSAGTTDLQREDATISFLYLGPEGLSLVVVHDSAADRDDAGGGAVTWTVEGVRDAEWAVKDDFYLDSETGEQAATNYDNWSTDGDAHTVDWTWGSGGTDGGALRAPDQELALTIRPAFNEAAALWGDHYAEAPIEEWQFLSFPNGRASPERIALGLDDPLTVSTVPCGEHGTGRSDDHERDGTVTVELHLKIGSFDLHRRGAIPVGLRFEEALEKEDIVTESLRFGPPDVVAAGGGARPAHGGLGDEPVFYFPVFETGFELGDTSAKLVGRTVDGRPIEGSVGVSPKGIDRNDTADEREQAEKEEDSSLLDDLFGSLF